MDHDGVGSRRGEQGPPGPPAAVPSFAGAAVLGLHLLLRLQGQQRRVQAHGPGPVWAARLPRRDPAAPDRSQARRQLPTEHALLQLLSGTYHDGAAFPQALRRSAAEAGVGPGTAARGPGGQHPGGDRGGAAGDLHPPPPRNGDAQPCPGRRRRPQLRRQRPAAPDGAVRALVDPAGGRGRRRRPGGGPLHLAPAAGQAQDARGERFPAGQFPGALLFLRRGGGRSQGAGHRLPPPGRGGAAARRGWPAGGWPGRWLVPGPDGVRAEGIGGTQHPRRPAPRRCNPR